MAAGKVNEDLIKERAKCTFDVEELTHFLDDGEEQTKRRRTLGKYSTIPHIIFH